MNFLPFEEGGVFSQQVIQEGTFSFPFQWHFEHPQLPICQWDAEMSFELVLQHLAQYVAELHITCQAI